jgi:uncharacterized membrane-anchored protein
MAPVQNIPARGIAPLGNNHNPWRFWIVAALLMVAVMVALAVLVSYVL